MKALVGFVWVVIIIWNGVAIVRRQRRSGEVLDHGHPTEDNLLLLGSAIAVVAIMLTAVWLTGPRFLARSILGGYFFALLIVPIASGVTFLATVFF